MLDTLRDVAKERTNWRDQEISNRHRDWGFNCPAVDLDFVMAEYNHGKPVAIIEYKHFKAQIPDLTKATYRALTDLADGYGKNGLPFFVAFYCPGDWWFRIIPVNEKAKHFAKSVAGIPISEQHYVRALYKMRKTVLDAEDESVIAKLKNIVPPL